LALRLGLRPCWWVARAASPREFDRRQPVHGQ
jgi:hypothetical protein